MDVILLTAIVIVAAILVLLLMVGMFGEFIYTFSDGKIFKSFYHDRLGIHLPNKYNDGEICTCKVCGKKMAFYQDTWVA